MITAKDLIVSAECVETSERLIGYVCQCKHCQTPFENEKYDKTRPLGLLTTPDGLDGNIRVYTDNMEFVNLQDNHNKKMTYDEYLKAKEQLGILLDSYYNEEFFKR